MQPGFFPASSLAFVSAETVAEEVLGRGKKTGPNTQLQALQDFMRGHCNLERPVHVHLYIASLSLYMCIYII